MAKLSAHKNLLITIGVIVVLALACYWYFSSSYVAPVPILSGSTAGSSDTLLATLDQLESLSLNPAIFSNPSFEALSNNTVTLPVVSSGRPNPFAPLSVAATQSTLVAPTH